jgi:putative tryptophan/tyrosine transport system substrate-binding protein
MERRSRLSRRQFVVGAAGLGLLVGCGRLPGQAQPPAKILRIGFLAGSSAEGTGSRVAAFQEGLGELGYVEGKTFTMEYRYAGGDSARLPELAADLVRLPVDLLIVQGTAAAHAAKQATSVIPIVIGNTADPVGAGLVASLARPGGNVTGLSDFGLAVVTKRLELLKSVAPSASRIAVLWRPSNPAHPLELKDTQAAGPVLGVTVLPLEVEDADGIDRAFATMSQERAGGLIVFGFTAHQRQIVELTAQNRLPAVYPTRVEVEAGGLMSYGASFEDLYRRAAVYVDKIVRGAKPADLPVEQPMRFDFVVNLKTARELGITFPHEILLQVTEVIQ